MKNAAFFVIILVSFVSPFFGQINNLPYPIIFVHGLNSSDEAFEEFMFFLRNNYNLGEINVFDVVLNADDNIYSAVLDEDVKWYDFYYNGDYINVGRRNFAEDLDDMQDGWVSSNIFAINFKEERIRGAAGFFNDYFDYSNQAAIFKQGYALRPMIYEVLNFTGAKKVILVGHSMGGLAIREYLQRTDDNNVHINWINPYEEDGHKVAKVITIGTPHLGSNAGFDPTKANIISEKSEAIRDLKWSYDSYTNCDTEPIGIYLFGGNEYCIASTEDNETFYNVDINCNGYSFDNIIGINFNTYDNPYMPLPMNIPYVWITSIWGEWNGIVGDGVVNIDRQWLRIGQTPAPVGITDTLLTFVFHTSETEDFPTIIRALDVPDNFDFSYELELDKEYIEFITMQPFMYNFDNDIFYVRTSPGFLYTVRIDEEYLGSGVRKIEIYNSNRELIISKNLYYLPDEIIFGPAQQEDIYYIKIIGEASTYNPYVISVSSDFVTSVLDEPCCDDFNVYYLGNKLIFSRQISGIVEIYSINGKLIHSKNLKNPTKTLNLALSDGIYIFKNLDNNQLLTKKFCVIKR